MMAKRTSLFCSGALFFASALAQPYHTDGGPSWIGTGWIGGGFSSPSADSAPGPSSSVTNPSIGSGGTPPTRLPGKLGGYGYGGGGGPCEAGCDWRPKPVATTTSSASDLAAAKAKRREVNLETYIAAAAAIYRVYNIYKKASTTQVAVNKLAFEWVGELAFRSVFVFYMLVRDGGIGDEPLEGMLREENAWLRQEIIDSKKATTEKEKQNNELKQRIIELQRQLKQLKEVQRLEGLPLTPKTPAHDLPPKFRGPAFAPDGAYAPWEHKEEEVRRRYLVDQLLDKDQAKRVVAKFLRDHQGSVLGELSATILEVYDADTIEERGLSAAAQDWLVQFHKFLVSSEDEILSKMNANAGEIQADRKFCTLAPVPAKGPCFCNAAPRQVGVLTTRPTGSVCQTEVVYCEMPYPAPIGTGCYCNTPYGWDSGSIEW